MQTYGVPEEVIFHQPNLRKAHKKVMIEPQEPIIEPS